MPKTKSILIAILMLSSVLNLLSCGDDSDGRCPSPSKIEGHYAFCVIGRDCYGDNGIDRHETTSNGYYEEGTEVVASALNAPGECFFRGWYDGPKDEDGELVSQDIVYVSIITKDTYLWARYYMGGY